jgi:hypothetical protein
LTVAFSLKTAATLDLGPVPLLFFAIDQFTAQNEGITFSPHVLTRHRLLSAVSTNVDTFYWLIVVFLKQTAAIKVKVPPTSLIFDGCHFGAPNK